MNPEESVRRRAERESQEAINSAKGKEVNKEESVADIMRSSEWSDLAEAVFMKEGQKDLAKKIIEGQKLDDVELKDLYKMGDKIKEMKADIERMAEILNDDTILENVATKSKEFAKLKEFVGLEAIKNVINTDFFINLFEEDESRYKEFGKILKAHQDTSVHIGYMEQQMKPMLDRFNIPYSDLETIFNMSDKDERSEELKKLIERGVPLRWYENKLIKGKGRKSREYVEGVLNGKLNEIDGKVDGYISSINKSLSALGEQLIKNVDAESRMSNMITRRKIKPEEKKMSFSFSAKVVENSDQAESKLKDKKEEKEIQKKWDEYKLKKAREIGNLNNDNAARNWLRNVGQCDDNTFNGIRNQFIMEYQDSFIGDYKEREMPPEKGGRGEWYSFAANFLDAILNSLDFGGYLKPKLNR